METNALTKVEQIQAISNMKQSIKEIFEDKAYIVFHEFAKVAKEWMEETKQEFKNYFDQNKELPYWFECKIRAWRKTYAFEQDMEWDMLNKKLKDREEFLKMVSDIEEKGGKYCDSETWEVFDGVKITYATESYAISKKQ